LEWFYFFKVFRKISLRYQILVLIVFMIFKIFSINLCGEQIKYVIIMENRGIWSCNALMVLNYIYAMAANHGGNSFQNDDVVEVYMKFDFWSIFDFWIGRIILSWNMICVFHGLC
jgi:hypothetical protein